MQALKILDDDTQCDIIKIGGLIRNKVHDAAFRLQAFYMQCVMACKMTQSQPEPADLVQVTSSISTDGSILCIFVICQYCTFPSGDC